MSKLFFIYVKVFYCIVIAKRTGPSAFKIIAKFSRWWIISFSIFGCCLKTSCDIALSCLQEPTPNKDLIAHPLVTSTPHLGASTEEAQTRVAEDIAQQFVDMMQGKELVGAVRFFLHH